MKFVVVLVLAAALALLPSAVARAAVLAVSTSGTSPSRTLTITPNAGTRVTVSRVGTELYVEGGSVSDTFNPATPTGCTNATNALNCGTGISRIVFNGSSGNDDFSVSPDVTAVVEAHGNNGVDEISGATGNDLLFGDAGTDVLRGGAGNDTINGGEGDDLILGEMGVDTIDGGNGADTMFGGGQQGDTLTYASRTAPVGVNLAAGTGGVAGEADSVADFTNVIGGSNADTLIGGAGNERLDGNNGADLLSGGPGADTLNGGNDADYLDARDSATDTSLSCGGGADRLIADLTDPTTTDCEVIAPLVVGDVSVTGPASEGGLLTVAFSGQVTGTDSTRAWVWSRCVAGVCAVVGDAASYSLTASDVGATVVATLRAGNDAGMGELASAAVGPVAALPPAPPPPAAPKYLPAGLSVRSASCSGKRCKLSVRVSGDVAALKAVLTRSGKTVASATRKTPAGTVKFNVTSKKTLRSGTYKLKVTVTGKDGRSKSSTRTLRVRRR